MRPGRRPAWRENLEATVSAIVLALVIRHFIFEAFQIPTGSMASTLVGDHRTLICPNCNRRFAVDNDRPIASGGATCPNCRYIFSTEQVAESPCRDIPSEQVGWVQWALADGLARLRRAPRPAAVATGGGNRILVNKTIYKYAQPRRWDVIVFKFPWLVCENPENVLCLYARHYEIPRRQTPKRCPACGSEDLEVRPMGGPAGVLEETRCKAPDCGWREVTRGPLDRCPGCGGSLVKKNYIKRLVGLPGEQIRLWHGDVYINGAIVRKPEHAQRVMWRFVCDSALPDQLPREYYQRAWDVAGGSLEREGSGFVLTPKDAEAKAVYARPINDFVAYNGGPADGFPVGDVKVELDIEVSGKPTEAWVRLDVDNDGLPVEAGQTWRPHAYELRLIGGAEGAVGQVCIDGAPEGKSFKLDAGQPRITLSHLDAALSVSINGTTVFRKLLDRPPAAVPQNGVASRLTLGAKGGPLRVRRMRVWRDTYYRHDERARYLNRKGEHQIGKWGYYALGDNSRSSADSRIWGEVPADFMIGKAFVVWWPVDGIRVAE